MELALEDKFEVFLASSAEEAFNALDVENKLGATNFSYSPNKALDISGFAIYNVSRIASKQKSFREYTDSDLGIPDESTDH